MGPGEGRCGGDGGDWVNKGRTRETNGLAPFPVASHRMFPMNKIKAILQADADGTLHLPVPPELRRGKVQVTATIEPVGGPSSGAAVAWAAAVARRQAALKELRDLGGLHESIPDPASWQRDLRTDRPLHGRSASRR